MGVSSSSPSSSGTTPSASKSYNTSQYTRGDIIYRYLDSVTYGKHKGVYLGDNYVIHFTQDDNGTGVVKKDSLEAFANGKDVHFYSRSSSRTADKAESIYNGGGRDWKTYDLLTRNCGHFVDECAK